MRKEVEDPRGNPACRGTFGGRRKAVSGYVQETGEVRVYEGWGPLRVQRGESRRGCAQGSLMCCSPWGHKESDMTERLN